MQLVPLLKMLEEGTVEYDGLTYPVLELEVVASPEQRPENLTFKWEVVELADRMVLLRVKFTDAMQVSAYGSPDILKVIFRDPYMFVGINNLAISVRQLNTTRLLQDVDSEEREFITLSRELP